MLPNICQTWLSASRRTILNAVVPVYIVHLSMKRLWGKQQDCNAISWQIHMWKDRSIPGIVLGISDVGRYALRAMGCGDNPPNRDEGPSAVIRILAVVQLQSHHPRPLPNARETPLVNLAVIVSLSEWQISAGRFPPTIWVQSLLTVHFNWGCSLIHIS